MTFNADRCPMTVFYFSNHEMDNPLFNPIYYKAISLNQLLIFKKS